MADVAQPTIRFQLGSMDLDFTDTEQLIPDVDSPLTPAVENYQPLLRLNGTALPPPVPAQSAVTEPRLICSDTADTRFVSESLHCKSNYQYNEACDEPGPGKVRANEDGMSKPAALQKVVVESCSGSDKVSTEKLSNPHNLSTDVHLKKTSHSRWNDLISRVTKELTSSSTPKNSWARSSEREDNPSMKKSSRVSRTRVSADSILSAGDNEDPEDKRRHSIFGDLNDPRSDDRPSIEPGLKNHLFSFIQAADNKLAMKLFGSRTALLKEKRRQYASRKWIIHPCSNFRLYWDLLMLIFLVTNLVVLPVAIAFFFNDMGSHWMIFNITCDSLFILDIFINFRTGIIDPDSHGDVILDGKLIAIRYLKSWFIIDFFSSLPIDYIFLKFDGSSYQAGRAIRILRLAKLLQLLRLLRISRLVRYIRIWQEYFSLASIVVRIFNLICVMVLLSHWSGCIQFFVPVIQGWPEDSWISIEKLQDVHWWDQYTKSLFKALSHMLCIGYGQFPPSNNTDMWLTIASMLAGATCYALFVGHATTLIQSFDTSSRQFRDHLQQVNEYMSFRKLPQDLRRKITLYYDRKYGGKMFDEQVILAELSHTLRADILSHNCQALIHTVPFFVNADPNFVSDVIAKLSYEMYMPGELIVKMNTKGDSMFFIQEGLVEVVDETNDKVVTRLSDGSYFGEISLLTNQKRMATVRAATYCNLFSLARVDFDLILTSYPLMKRTLETIAAQRLHHLGKDPAMVTSRESLLDDINGIQRVIQVNQDLHSDDEEHAFVEEDAPNDNQFLTAVKSFFTTDSDRNRQLLRPNSYISSPKKVKETPSYRAVSRVRSNLHHLVAPLAVPAGPPRRAKSSIELSRMRANSHTGAATTPLGKHSPTLDRNANHFLQTPPTSPLSTKNIKSVTVSAEDVTTSSKKRKIGINTP